MACLGGYGRDAVAPPSITLGIATVYQPYINRQAIGETLLRSKKISTHETRLLKKVCFLRMADYYMGRN